MSARNFVKMSVVALLMWPASVFAQTPTRAQALPDLVPVDLDVDKDCRIVVTLQNNGPGNVPDAGFSLGPPGSSGVQMYKGGAPWGAVVLGTLDPSHLSQPVGGTVSYTWYPALDLPPGSHEVKVDVDTNNSIVEGNELNNSLTERLTCQRPLPDLQPTDLTLDADCRIDVTLGNNGPGAVPDSGYTYSNSRMYSDGAPWGTSPPLGSLDPAPHLSQPVGGTKIFKWVSAPPLLPGSHTVKVDIDFNNKILEANEANNSLTKSLTCQQPLPDLQPTDLALDADCRIEVTFRNNGPAAVPESGYALVGGGSLRMYNDGAPFEGTLLNHADPFPHLSQPVGGTKVYKGSLPLDPGSHVVRVDLDNSNKIAEANESNNSITETFNCQRPLPDLVPTNITLQQTGPSVTSPCQILVTLRNNGPGIVPDAAFVHVPQAPNIQMWKGSAGFGGAILGLIDPQKVLQPAGATLLHVWMMGAAKLVPPGEHTLRLEVDPGFVRQGIARADDQ